MHMHTFTSYYHVPLEGKQNIAGRYINAQYMKLYNYCSVVDMINALGIP